MLVNKYDPITGALRDQNGHYVRWIAKGYSEISMKVGYFPSLSTVAVLLLYTRSTLCVRGVTFVSTLVNTNAQACLSTGA